MKAAARLGLFGVGLGLVFVVFFIAGRALIPESTVADWTREATEGGAGHEAMTAAEEGSHVRGLSLSQDGFTLSPVRSPATSGEPGRLSFRILDEEEKPFTDFATSHQKQLHLIVVRADGAEFRHAHPPLDRGSGTWSLPWQWPTGGSYRVFTDFVPGGQKEAPAVTLTRSVEVAGEVKPEQRAVSREAAVDGFEVTLKGKLSVGESRELTARITRNGRPVTSLEPYLGAFGHLVALREGDLAYLHVHAEGVEPGPGETAGPAIGFETEAPSPGRYLLYLDFKIDGRVHTARFVLEAR